MRLSTVVFVVVIASSLVTRSRAAALPDLTPMSMDVDALVWA